MQANQCARFLARYLQIICPQADLYSLQLILQCSRACPQLCQAAVLAKAPEALLRLRDGANGALALLALTAVLDGLHARRGAAGASGGTAAAAAQSSLVPGPATDDAIRRLAGTWRLHISAAGVRDVNRKQPRDLELYPACVQAVMLPLPFLGCTDRMTSATIWKHLHFLLPLRLVLQASCT